MKRTGFIVIGAVLGAGVVAAGSIAAYEYFRYDDGREWIERTRAMLGDRDTRRPRIDGDIGTALGVGGDVRTPVAGGVERDDGGDSLASGSSNDGAPSAGTLASGPTTARADGAVSPTPGVVLPLAQALEIAARHLPGEVLKVELDRDDGRTVYEIKVLAENGRVREIKFDAYNGEVLEIEDD